jgi:hypothetical protein
MSQHDASPDANAPHLSGTIVLGWFSQIPSKNPALIRRRDAALPRMGALFMSAQMPMDQCLAQHQCPADL